MNYSKLFDEFINETVRECPYATEEELKEVAIDMLNILNSNKDATPEEYVEKVIESDIDEMERLRNDYLLPGYTMGINVGNINVKYLGGNMDSFGTKMKADAMYDIASMSKMYTQVVLFNLIKEGQIRLDDKISDLDTRFSKIGDVSIRELSEFKVEFMTPGNITNMENIEDAKEALFNIEIAKYPDGNLKRGKYFYTDFGMMILKEVMEAVTNKKYTDLVDEYITNKLSLFNTKIIVPTEKYDLLTGSPNVKYGTVNDPKAIAVGGYSGHAGVFASSDDLIKFGKGLEDGTLLDNNDLEKANTKGIKDNRGIMGNTYVVTPEGLDNSYIETISNSSDFAIQGSTRTHLNIGKDSVSTILLNPSSLSIKEALEEQERINEMRKIQAQKDNKEFIPISIVKHFKFNRDGKALEYDMVDARSLLNYRQVDPLTTMNAKTSLKLRFLSKVISEYDKNYTKKVEVSKSI